MGSSEVVSQSRMDNAKVSVKTLTHSPKRQSEIIDIA